MVLKTQQSTGVRSFLSNFFQRKLGRIASKMLEGRKIRVGAQTTYFPRISEYFASIALFGPVEQWWIIKYNTMIRSKVIQLNRMKNGQNTYFRILYALFFFMQIFATGNGNTTTYIKYFCSPGVIVESLNRSFLTISHVLLHLLLVYLITAVQLSKCASLKKIQQRICENKNSEQIRLWN